MICQECNKRPATLHFTKIINGDKTEVHICEQCAQEKGEMFMFPGSTGFSINNLLAGMFNLDSTLGTKQNAFHQGEVVQCDVCKMTLQQFVKIGRFGCTNCYQTFNNRLNPILKRLHSGNISHTGKIPKRIGGTIHVRKEIDQLKQRLQELIRLEEFEKAAETRDRIRYLEKSISVDREGVE